MKMLELYCGTKAISNAFKRIGWETYTVDWNAAFNPTRVMDISKITMDEIIEICEGSPDVIWASPDCTTYSFASSGLHRIKSNNYLPKTEYGMFCDSANRNLSKVLLTFNGLVFIENPRDAMRDMGFWNYPRYTVTYCQYGHKRQKPTDIWTNHPNPAFKPCCKKTDNCHEHDVKGTDHYSGVSKIQRSAIPERLADHIARICDDYYKEKL